MANLPDTPLRAAIKENAIDKVKALLSAGADVNEGRPLRLACSLRCLEIVKLLLVYGADPNQTDQDLDTALLCCCDGSEHQELRVELVSLLLTHNAKIDIHPKNQDGALHKAAMYGHPELLRLLIEAGADVNEKGGYGRTPLIYAASSGVVASLQMLITAGADVNAKNEGGQNALFDSISGLHPSANIVEVLIDAGIDLTLIAQYNHTAFTWAANYGQHEIVELLLRRGVDINQKAKGETALSHALQRKKFDTVNLLLDRGADVNDEYFVRNVISSGNQKLAERVIKQTTKKTPKALQEAAREGKITLARMLLDAGVDVNGKTYDGDETPLIKAASNGKLKMVELLVKKGAALEARDGRGNTALLHAAWGGHTMVVQFLIDHGADLAAQNKLNWNALMQACAENHVETAKLLIELGSPLNEVDQERGYTALTIAKVASSQSLVDLLLKHGAKERELQRPVVGEYFPITACGICAYLPHQKELGRTTYPELIPNLENLLTTSTDTDRYATTTTMLKRCPICGTYYHQEHSIDTEDDFAKGGPSISQSFARYNLLPAQEALQAADKIKEQEELAQRYPALIASMKEAITSQAQIAPNVLLYFVQSLIEDYILNGDWAALDTVLLQHPRAELALAAARDVLDIYGRAYPRNAMKTIREKLTPWLLENIALFEKRVRAFSGAQESHIQKSIAELLSSMRHQKLIS
jgi:ankyrin repeat protein